MTGSGDTDEYEEPATDDEADEGETATPVRELHLNEDDHDPTAGGSDIGGRAGDAG